VSRENVEIVRRTFERMAVGWEALVAILDPAVEWDSTQRLPDGKVVRGIEAATRSARSWLGAFEDYSREVEELIDAGDNVVSVVRVWGKGKGSGAPVEGRIAQVWTFRDGKVVRYREFPDRAQALKAAGLVHG
jgi:ketosteroid isomerase-like protein